MPEFQFQEMFPHGEDTTPYRRLDGDVAVEQFRGEPVLTVPAAGLTRLAAAAVRDVSHLFRPGHLRSCARSSTTPRRRRTTASSRSTCCGTRTSSAGMVLPSCQDTGTAIVIGKKGQRVWSRAATTRRRSRAASSTPTARPTCATRSWRR